MRLIALAPFAVATALASPVLAADPSTMAMTGHGEVTAAPDTAFITSGVTTQGDTARDALDANTKAMADLLSTLKSADIAERDIQTSNFTVSPNYVYSDTRDANGYTQPPKINGYQVSNSVTVRVRNLDDLGTILDKAVSVGANTINGVNFTVDDPSKLYDEARKQAFADAKAKADLYAEAAGVSLAHILNISEQQNFSQPPQPYARKAMAMADAGAPVPVQAGELSFAVDVSVTWDIGSGQ